LQKRYSAEAWLATFLATFAIFLVFSERIFSRLRSTFTGFGPLCVYYFCYFFANNTRCESLTNAIPAATRSRVSNGREVLPGVDQRSAVARRYRDLIGAIVTDQGGAAQLSEARMQLVRRFAAASVLAEQMEARLACGERIDISEHALLCSSLVRLSSRIGINRMSKSVETLADYLAANYEAPP
jgi:hypothetical protein